MNDLAPLPALLSCGVTLVIGLPTREALLDLVAELALHGPLRVVVGGNRFDAHRLSRLVRQQTVQVDGVLARVQVVRPFTCYQTLALLAQTQDVIPLLVLDLLTTLADESISDRELTRLLTLATAHLRRCGQHVPVLVTAQPLSTPGRQGLTAILQNVADQVITYQPPQSLRQLSLEIDD